MSDDGMVVVNGFRYRVEDAERLGLIPGRDSNQESERQPKQAKPKNKKAKPHNKAAKEDEHEGETADSD